MITGTMNGQLHFFDENTFKGLENYSPFELRICWGDDPIMVEITSPALFNISGTFNLEEFLAVAKTVKDHVKAKNKRKK